MVRRLQRKKLVDGDFQFAGKIQRHFGVGDIRPSFNSVNGLTADIHAARQIGCADASALSNLGQPVLNARLHNSYFLA